MRRRSVTITAYRDIDGSGPRWLARSAEPWFEILPGRSLAGRWIRLRWSAGLLDPVARPVLRCLRGEATSDFILPAAPFGRQSFTCFIPDGAERYLLSPADTIGPFGFHLEAIDVLSPVRVRTMAARRDVLVTLHGLGANFIGRPHDGRSLVRDALAYQPLERYARWRKAGLRDFDPEGIDGAVADGAQGLVVRILAAVDGPDDAGRLVRDLQGGPHRAWRLALVPGFAADAGALAAVAAQDPRIEIVKAGAVAGWVAGCDPADFVGVVPARSRLDPLTTAQVALASLQHPKSDLLFADDDVAISAAKRALPAFKPAGESPLLPSEWRFGAALFVRARSLSAGSGIAIGADDAGRPLAFRCAHSGPASHIARVLVSVPPWARNRPARSETKPPPRPGPARNGADEISIIVPTRDRLALLRPCIESLLARTTGRYQIIIADNGSRQQKTLNYFKACSQDPRIVVAAMPGPFNFSRLCNAAAARTTAPVLVFLNNDTEAISPNWLDAVLPLVRDPRFGAVGAKLLYRSGRVQHAGCVLGLGGRAGHFEYGIAADDPGYFGRANVPHRVSAVTGAFLAIERWKFAAVGGFDEKNLPIDLNDIDLCLRLNARGWQTVMQPECRFLHHESATRGRVHDTDAAYRQERAYFSAHWLAQIRSDPYFSPALSLYNHRPSLG